MKTYDEIFKKNSGKMYKVILFLIFIQRSLGILYVIDLSFKLIKTIHLFSFGSDFQIILFLFFLHTFCTFVYPSPESLNFARSRNIITLLAIFLVTASAAFINFGKNQDLINFDSSADQFFDSWGLIAICFSQQILTTPILSTRMANKTASTIISGIISSFSYISIGLLGYIAYASPEINWCTNISDPIVKSLLSSVLLVINLLTYPIITEPIKQIFDHSIPQRGLNKNSGISKLLVAIIYTFMSIHFVKSSYGPISLMFFSSFIMMIVPCLFFSKIFKNEYKWKLPLLFNFSVALFLVFKALSDLLGNLGLNL